MHIRGASVQKTEGRKENYTVSVLATPFLLHIQYKFCVRFSFITAGHWKSGYVLELFSSQRGLGKRGKIDFASGYGPLLANGADQTAVFMAMAQHISTLFHFRAFWALCMDVHFFLFTCWLHPAVEVALFHDAGGNWCDGSGLKTQGLKIISDIQNYVRSVHGEVTIFLC